MFCMVKILKRFYEFLLKYRKEFILFVVILVISVTLENLSPYFYKLMIEEAPKGNYAFLFKLLLVFTLVRIVGNLGHTLAFYIGDLALIPASRDARMAVFNQVQDLDFAFHVNKSTGSLISAFKRGDSAFFELFHNIHFGVLEMLISLLVTLFFFAKISLVIVLLMLLIFLVNLWIGWVLIKRNIQKRNDFNVVEDEISGIITDNLINYETVKFFAQEKNEEKRLLGEFKDWWVKIWSYANSFRMIDVIIGTLSSVGAFFILWLVVVGVSINKVSAGDLVMVVTFTSGLYWRFFDLIFRLRNIAKHYADIQRYFEILDSDVLIKDPSNPVKVGKIRGEIRFEGVDFAYPDNKEKKVLEAVDLLIQPGESVAFVGRSGAGKTTVVKLLLRFYDVTSGQISVDGIDVRNFAKTDLRSFIGVVPQEPILFNNTVGFNIAYGRNKSSREEIVKAAKMASIHSFIESLPEKYETQVGERGIKLSGGQKQRLAIARMLLIDPVIIIFDEATSNLDSESERLIQKALWKIAKKRTVLIIAHRFATVRRAGRIVVMEDGRIVESGTHQDLIDKKGIYAYLWELQSKGQLEDEDLRR